MSRVMTVEFHAWLFNVEYLTVHGHAQDEAFDSARSIEERLDEAKC